MSHIDRDTLFAEMQNLIDLRNDGPRLTPQQEIDALDVDVEAWMDLVAGDVEACMEALRQVLDGGGHTEARPITYEQLAATMATQFHDGFVLGMRLRQARSAG